MIPENYSLIGLSVPNQGGSSEQKKANQQLTVYEKSYVMCPES